jgi:catechol 2,3-dioxygenase-like lactoylglutathione lyase family enzyme
MTSPEPQSMPAASRPTPPAPVAFHGAVPILPVRDLAASLDHYVRVLGFALDWEDAGMFASVSRDRCCLFLCQDDQGHPGTWAWLGVADAEALHDELHARGAHVRQPPTNFAWALEMQIEDPDGNVLRLGSDPKPGVAHGPWLDMRGLRWVPGPGGQWTRADDASSEAARTDGGETVDTAETPVVAAPAEQPVRSPGDAVTRARVLKEMGEQARRGGDLAGARRLYEEAVALQREGSEPLELAHTIRHLGDVLHDARMPHLAEPHYQEALALHRAQPDVAPLNLANAIRSLAVLKQELGDRDASRRLWEEASRLYQQVDVREGVAESAGWAARLAWRAGDVARAREWLAAARAASDASSDRETWKFVREVGLELGG